MRMAEISKMLLITADDFAEARHMAAAIADSVPHARLFLDALDARIENLRHLAANLETMAAGETCRNAAGLAAELFDTWSRRVDESVLPEAEDRMAAFLVFLMQVSSEKNMSWASVTDRATKLRLAAGSSC